MLKKAFQTKSSKFYLLIFILVLAAVLRFFLIDQPFIDGTSWRESDTATIAENFYRGNWNILYPEVSWNGPANNYVGYEFQTLTYITAFLYRIFGQHDWVARSVAVLFGLWGIFAFHQLVRRVWNQESALVSTAVLAFLPGNICVDRTFVPDPVMVSLVVTSVWLLVAYLQTEHLHYLLLASLIGMWGFLTKISGIFVGIPMLYAVLTILSSKQRLRSKQLALLGGAALLILIPVVAYYLWAIHISRTYPPYHIAASGYWVWKFGLHHFLKQNYFLPELYAQLTWLWTKPLIILIVVGLFLWPPYSQRNSNADEPLEIRASKAPWLFHWWVLAFVIYYLIAAQGLVENPTNLNIINPAVAALAGNTLMAIASFTQRIVGATRAVVLIAVILLILGGVGSKNLKSMYSPYAENAYKLGLALNQISQPNDLVVTIAQDIGDPIAIYYSRRRGWVFPPATTWSKLDWWNGIRDDSEAIRLLKELQTKEAKWFGIVKNQKDKIWKENPKLAEYIEQKFSPISTPLLKCKHCKNIAFQDSPDYIIYRIP
ncbi:glycosyltransferase family 39 protein [Nostoc sp. CENA67]|uniref:Glycosyltransferase family 39 protein n=1 Tax=Amazonocrinis nigriterrae CENA67 TaxID=2794033 RepID=A0A8J7HYL9_9NOST|nr:glycosyltransferase family 39 protein [Amazonocrinis nigriterrae]MBH8566030.1 glycosyltransferase family 39 protein [Amazonocrinis nigriterrae CENA67]